MNQKTWKKIAAVGMCVCMTAGFTACSGEEKGGAGRSGESVKSTKNYKSDKKVTLRYAIWGATQQDVSKELADAFHEKYPNITVEV